MQRIIQSSAVMQVLDAAAYPASFVRSSAEAKGSCCDTYDAWKPRIWNFVVTIEKFDPLALCRDRISFRYGGSAR